MAGIKISGLPYPFALKAGAAMNGTEVFPADQTVSGVKSTVGLTAAQMLAYFGSSGTLTAPVTINSTTGQVSLTVNAATGQPGVINTGSDIVEQGLQVQGSGTSGFTGPGIELEYTGSAGQVLAYNRTSFAYLPINVIGSTVALNIGATAALSIDASLNTNIAFTNAAYGATYGAVGGVRVNNLSSTMQSSLDFGKNGVLSGRIRNDYVGNMTYATTGSGVHTFFVGGDSGVGTATFTVASGGTTVGSPTGGAQGAGTINAQGLYINGVAVGGSIPTYKPATATETRTSTTTLSNSTQLTYAIPATGTYEIECLLTFYGTGGTQGVAYNLNYSGTFTANSSPFINVASGYGGSNITGSVTTALDSHASILTSASAPTVYLIKATLTATGTGTLAMAFAQNSSSANATTLGIGSYMNVTKVA